ncbi:hypothetical protein BaRGS_00025046 [Batillaria attramentaria]|uniref:Uncharacterized protein n=1 Tax=Batillaria attramentaria TaxID=370345 RepID=A0ABD0K9J0_9CAEN
MMDLLISSSSLATCLLVGILLAASCHGNQFDPHLYPKTGPFFEGWYLRIIDDAQELSLGLLFGRVLPSDHARATGSGDVSFNSYKSTSMSKSESLRPELTRQRQEPLVLATVLLQSKAVGPKLQSFNGFFNVADFSVTVKGKPVVKNPDDESPADFAVQFGNSGNNGSYIVSGNKTSVEVTVGNIRLVVKGSNPVPWGPHGEGPEGWLEDLPLPLHWFVYSLRSHVSEYKFLDRHSGMAIVGKNARMHMEKNWGESFPPGWIWAQGITTSNIALALSGGIVDFHITNVTAFLVGYRNPAKGIVFNFTPANSVFSFKHNGCDGFVHLNITSLEHSLVLKVFSPLSSFSSCLFGPEKYGFRPVCVESYNAAAVVSAYQRNGLHYALIDHVEIRSAALEFGGLYVCKRLCP